MVESIVFMSLLFVLCLLGLPIVAIVVLISRATSSTSKERMEMIKRGMIPPEKVEHKPNRLKSLRTGLGAIGLGVGAIASIWCNLPNWRGSSIRVYGVYVTSDRCSIYRIYIYANQCIR